MADVVSLVAAGVGIGEVAFRLIAYLKDIKAAAKTVDEDIEGLINEVEGLQKVHGHLEKEYLKSMTNVDMGDDERSLWASTGQALKNGQKYNLRSKAETILCAGAVDTPRLMLLSGLGPKKQLQDLSIPVVKDIPGVGENLLDHPESIIIWELNKAVPPNQTTMDSDAGIFLRREAPNARGDDGENVDIMMHCYQIPFCLNTER